MTYWASVLTVMGYLYAALASLWPYLFQRDMVKSVRREAMGFRIGLWIIYWCLPVRAAVLIMLLSLIPILVVVFLTGWLVILVLGLMTCLILFFWMFSPPGMVIGFADQGMQAGRPVIAQRPQKLGSRTILIFALCGLVPGLGMGALLNGILARIVS